MPKYFVLFLLGEPTIISVYYFLRFVQYQIKIGVNSLNTLDKIKTQFNIKIQIKINNITVDFLKNGNMKCNRFILFNHITTVIKIKIRNFSIRKEVTAYKSFQNISENCLFLPNL